MLSKLSIILILIIIVASMGSVSAQYSVDFNQAKWHDSFCYGDEICLVGQFNGIGGDDIISFVRSSKGDSGDGDVWVAMAAGDHFEDERVWNDSFCYGEEVCGVGDFDGDGRDDIIAFVRSSKGDNGDGDVWVALNNGRAFVNPEVWHDSFCYDLEACLIGDFNGDGRDDIAAATGPMRDGEQADEVWVALSNGSSFGEARVWGAISGCNLRNETYSCMAGDFDGDGSDDIASHDWETDRVWVITGGSNRFASEELWLNTRGSHPDGDYPYFCNLAGQTCAVGDYDGDGVDDVFTFVRDTLAEDHPDAVFLNHNFGMPYSNNREEDQTGFGYVFLAGDAFCIAGAVCLTGDFNDDEKADIVVFYRSLYPEDTLAGDVFVLLNRLDR